MVAKNCMILNGAHPSLSLVNSWSRGLWLVNSPDASVLYWWLENGKSLNFEVRWLHLGCTRGTEVTCHCVPWSCTHRIVPTERQWKSIEINLKVGSRLEGVVLFESFLLVVSCRYRGLASKASSMGCSTSVARELEARKFWKDQYVHFCCE